MAFTTTKDIIEHLWEDDRIQPRFDCSLEEAISIASKASDKQAGFIYHLYQKDRYIEIYKILKNLGLRPRIANRFYSK